MIGTRVKDFAAKLLEEIDLYQRQATAKAMEEMKSAGKETITTATSGSGESAAALDPYVLVRYESDASILTLKEKLNARLNDESQVSDENLQIFIELLLKRHAIIKDTNSLYNYSPYSVASLCYVALAKNLFNTLYPIKQQSGREITHLHYYDYLFPDFPCRKYKSDTGHLGELELTDFFWGEDVYKDKVLKEPGRPIPVLRCLEARRLAQRSMRPPHVFLTHEERELQAKAPPGVELPAPVISRADNSRLISHSDEANAYFIALNKKNAEGEKDELKIKLLGRVCQPGFMPGYLFDPVTSNNRLIKNEFLITVCVTKLSELAYYLSNRVHPEDWKAFLDALPEDEFFKLTLPKTANGADLSQLDLDKFKAFVNNPTWYILQEDRQNYATLTVLAELYRRKRNNHEGMFGNGISGALGAAHSRTAKSNAVDVLIDFFVSCANSQFTLNQLEPFLKKSLKFESHGSAIRSDRLLILVNKAEDLWNEILKRANPPLENSIDEQEVRQPPSSLVYNEEILKIDAERLSRTDFSEWRNEIKLINRIAFAGYIGSCGGANGLYNCIINPKLYIKGNEAYNRAVLYILVNHYINIRGVLEENTTSYGGAIGAYKRNTKVEAGKTLAGFFESGMPLNQLHEYLVKVGKLDQEGVIYDSTFSVYSLTRAFASTAKAVLEPDFFMDPAKKSGFFARFGM